MHLGGQHIRVEMRVRTGFQKTAQRAAAGNAGKYCSNNGGDPRGTCNDVDDARPLAGLAA